MTTFYGRRLMTVWAIRVKGTKKYLPDRGKRWGRGHTFDEPVHIEDGVQSPRLFLSERGAIQAMHAWYRGKYSLKKSTDFMTGDVDFEFDIESIPERLEIKLEVVEIMLSTRGAL
jgi:hypothetical protein